MSQGYDQYAAPDYGPDSSRGFDQYGLPTQETKSGRGCLFYGCITAIVLFLLLIVGIYLIFQKISSTWSQYVATYTDTTAAQLPLVEMPDEERQAVVKRAEGFKKALTAAPADNAEELTEEERTLVLTVDELNALFEQSPEVRGKFYVNITDDQLKAQVSLPLDGFFGLKGRYLNAEANVDVSIDDGSPVLRLKDIRVKGRPLPKEIGPMIERTNWLENAKTADGTPISPLLARRIEKIEVKDGKLIVIARKENSRATSERSESDSILEWKAADGGNGHYYELVRTPRSWTDADQDARSRAHQGMKGHLATITSEQENAFLRDRVAVDSRAWIGLTDEVAHGGSGSQGKPDPKRDGWVWVTREPVSFVAWSEGEPTHRGAAGDEGFVEFNGLFGSQRGQWIDRPDEPEGGRFAIVEYEPAQGAAPESSKSPAH